MLCCNNDNNVQFDQITMNKYAFTNCMFHLVVVFYFMVAAFAFL